MVAALSPAARADAIAKMSERDLDVLVVGGGVVGAGSALDAVTRGLSTAIIEARDWASGSISDAPEMMPSWSRSHCTAEPVTAIDPSSA